MRKSCRGWSVALLLLLAVVPARAADTCSLAGEIAGKAAQEFAKDQAAGLKLFIKAQQLCPDDARLNYNLGVAYYQYGSLNEARRSLQLAVDKDGSRAAWLNNLAAVILEQGSDPRSALELTRRGVKLDGNSAPLRTTLIQAELAAGNHDTAVAAAKDALAKFASDRDVQKAYSAAMDAALAVNLEKIRGGQVQPGLDGLKKLSDLPEGARAYILALSGLGRGDEALQAGAEAASRFPRDSAVKTALDEAADRVIQQLYADYRAGKAGTSVAKARELNGKYPQVAAIGTTYDKLLSAFLNEAKEIDVPKVIARSQSPAGQGRADQLLAGLSGQSPGNSEPVDLAVDVDEKIPKGFARRPSAVAVVIGNQSYAQQGRGINDVRWAGRDARVMQKYLVEVLGYDPKNIIYEIDTTSGDLRNIFGSKDNPRGRLHNFVRAGESEVFIYYVGHGAPGADGASAYLVPVDAEADYIANNGYPLDLFYQVLRDLPAKSKTVVIDACFSGDSPAGALFKNISPAMVRNVRALQSVDNSVIFSSADKDQVSTWYDAKRHSLFTYFFLKGLGGEADSNRDKAITAGELKGYLAKEVQYWANREANRNQTPLMSGDESTILARLQ